MIDLSSACAASLLPDVIAPRHFETHSLWFKSKKGTSKLRSIAHRTAGGHAPGPPDDMIDVEEEESEEECSQLR